MNTRLSRVFSAVAVAGLLATGLSGCGPGSAAAFDPPAPSTQPINIVDLINQGTIQVYPRGSGIQSVSVEIRNRTSQPVTVSIPAGTLFVPHRGSTQSMVTTGTTTQSVGAGGSVMVSCQAACADRVRDIPGSGDSFSVQRSPHQQELASLTPVLDKAGASFAVRQAAVWIVTDNATYSELGILVRRPAYGGPGTRVIKENDAARAMKLCDQAGINIRNKRIWWDRLRILNAVTDPELRAWLVSRN